MRESELIAALDRAYRFDGDDASWLEELTATLSDLLDGREGLHAFLVDISDAAAPKLHTPVAVGLRDDWARRWEDDWWWPFMKRVSPASVAAMLGHSTCNYSHSLWPAVTADVAEFGELIERHRARPGQERLPQTMRYPDSLNLIALDSSGLGCAIVANRAQVVDTPMPASEAKKLERLAAHIAAAYRLRKRRVPSGLEGAEAIFDERGRVLHAEGEARSVKAREALRATAVQVDAARRDEGPSGPDALEGWQALTSGRWTVLDQFDRDGRRYFVARPNESEVAPHPRLTDAELRVLKALALGHSNALIAYELGLHPSTVSARLGSAQKKLGVSARLELVRKARELTFGEL